jgi:serine/threonine protein kinase
MSSMKVAFTVTKGSNEGHSMEFSEPRGFVIGRARDADYRLPEDDPYVGRRHVYLEICPPRCRLQDLGSTNVAHVNGKPVTECELADGDVIELGYTQFRASITTQVMPEVHRCGVCGARIELLQGDPVPDRCATCNDQQRPPTPEAPAALAVRCSSCDADLTGRANSDGRGRELRDVAIYACDKHVPPGDSFAGSKIGDYEVRRLLGTGGMGAVYLVYHSPTARVLAIKQLKDLRDPLLIKRFDREIRLLRGLTHSNIVRCIDTGIDAKGRPYLVVEFVPDGSLQSEVNNRGGRLPQHEAVRLVCEALNGLEYIHAQSIIHRDIKPDNILLRRTITGIPGQTAMGMHLTPKLSDFGLAVSYARAGGTRVTKRGTGMGTLMYTSPEQIKDAANVQASADIYSIGVMLYYLLTGHYTFNFPTPADVAEFAKKAQGAWKRPQDILHLLMQKHRIEHPFQIILNEEPTPILQRDGSILRELADVVDRAVRKDASTRFQTAAEFRQALQQTMG